MRISIPFWDDIIRSKMLIAEIGNSTNYRHISNDSRLSKFLLSCRTRVARPTVDTPNCSEILVCILKLK